MRAAAPPRVGAESSRRSPLALIAGTAALIALAGDAAAITLREALVAAYRTNPQLTAARASLRALEEGVAQASSLGRPVVGSSIGIVQDLDVREGFEDAGSAVAGAVDLSYPFFQGGLVRNAVRAAGQRVEAGRLDLNGIENRVALGTATAYMDVLRDEAVVELSANQVRVLGEQLQASRDRFAVGDVTRTDVAQSEARLANARSGLSAAVAQLTVSRESFREVVGLSASGLEQPPPLPALPPSAAEAVRMAVAESPQLLAARATERAEGFDVGVARAERSPVASATTGLAYEDYLGSIDRSLGIPSGSGRFDETTLEQTVGVTVTIPLYQAGAVASRIRQAQAERSRAVEEIVLAERAVAAEARNAYEGLMAAQAVIDSAGVAVAANELALQGVRAENSVGTRTILEVLNAEQELLNSRVELVRAQRDAYVAGYALLAAIGRADAEGLALPAPRSDPDPSSGGVRGSWSDWRTGPLGRPAPTATSTVDQLLSEPGSEPAESSRRLRTGETATEPGRASPLTPRLTDPQTLRPVPPDAPGARPGEPR